MSVVRRWEPPTPTRRRPPPRRTPWYALPWIWWRRHAWIVVWVLVFLTPAALLSLRLIDDTDFALLIPALLVVMALIFLVVLGIAVRSSLRRSGARALAGGASAVLAAALLAMPMIHVIGQRICPERMGADRGIEVSMQLLEAWRKGEPAASELWSSDGVAEAWKPRTDGLTLLDYRLVDSGCWERLAPVTTKKTWHEFRVTVQQGDNETFSKIVVVHTLGTGNGWKIDDIDGLET